MKFEFQPLPGERRLRPVISFAFKRFPRRKIPALVDSGAVATRVSSEWAELLEIDLSTIEPTWVKVAGGEYATRRCRTEIVIGKYNLETDITFVDGWRFAHSILGLDGFFNRFIVRIDATDTHLTLIPKAQPSRPLGG